MGGEGFAHRPDLGCLAQLRQSQLSVAAPDRPADERRPACDLSLPEGFGAGTSQPVNDENDLGLPARAAALDILTAALARHDALYHGDDSPEISDADYDALKRRALEIEDLFPDLTSPASPSQVVGAAASSQFAPVRHGVPMLSLDNAFSAEEVTDFVARIRRFLKLPVDEVVAFVGEPKIDGLSASLRYEHGRLVTGATRGDGRTGEDVTANLRTIADIPQTLSGSGWPELIEVRGEVYAPNDAFDAFNAAAEAEGQRTYANPRNCAAGLKRPSSVRLSLKKRLTAPGMWPPTGSSVSFSPRKRSGARASAAQRRSVRAKPHRKPSLRRHPRAGRSRDAPPQRARRRCRRPAGCCIRSTIRA